MTRTPINRDAARAILGRDLMEEATLHTFADGAQAYIRPLTPADMTAGQKLAIIKKGDLSKGIPDETDQTRMALAIAIQVVVDENGKPIYLPADLAVLMKSTRGQEMIAIAANLLNAASEKGNESPKPTEEEPAPQ